MTLLATIRRWLCARGFHLYRFDHRAGAFLYYECRCGTRTCRWSGGGYSALDDDWLNRRKPAMGSKAPANGSSITYAHSKTVTALKPPVEAESA